MDHNRYFISDQLMMLKKTISVRNRMYRALLKTGPQRSTRKSDKIEYCIKNLQQLAKKPTRKALSKIVESHKNAKTLEERGKFHYWLI